MYKRIRAWIHGARRGGGTDKRRGDRAHFTTRARHAMELAAEEAQGLNHNYIGTEHVLLGLLREEDGLAGRALAGLGVKLPAARAAIVARSGRGPMPVTGPIGVAPRVKQAIAIAVEEARALDHNFLGTEHLLLGLLEVGGIGAEILAAQGITPALVRERLLALLAGT